jgi:hypothetical protein
MSANAPSSMLRFDIVILLSMTANRDTAPYKCGGF